jgi:hypothetical protein
LKKGEIAKLKEALLDLLGHDGRTAKEPVLELRHELGNGPGAVAELQNRRGLRIEHAGAFTVREQDDRLIMDEPYGEIGPQAWPIFHDGCVGHGL